MKLVCLAVGAQSNHIIPIKMYIIRNFAGSRCFSMISCIHLSVISLWLSLTMPKSLSVEKYDVNLL